MKIGKKGFMLAEVVVVSVVVVTVLVVLFTGVNNVSSAYETRNKYYDVDSLYVAMEINDILIANDSVLSSITTGKDLNSFNLNDISNFNNFYSDVTHDSIYAYFTPYNKNTMLTLKGLNSNLTFSEYLDYLGDNLNFDDENYNYMIIVERRADGNVDDCYYYALKLKY